MTMLIEWLVSLKLINVSVKFCLRQGTQMAQKRCHCIDRFFILRENRTYINISTYISIEGVLLLLILSQRELSFVPSY